VTTPFFKAKEARPLGNVIINNPNFRPGTETQRREIVFSMMRQGQITAALGDMICWMPAIEYVAENYNFVLGHLMVPPFFHEIAANIMRKYPHWRVHTKLPERLADGAPLKLPMDHPINATGMHLIDLGFVYFTGINPVPEGAKLYSRLDLEDVAMPKELEDIGAYVVMTPGASAVTRTMLPSVFNAITKHLQSKGITPVFLGDREMYNRKIGFDERYDLTVGVDLIGKTTLLQAAKIMEFARMVMGIDNGLLHLAALTDVTILYGYTMTGPEQRRVYREHGHTVELYANKKDVPCLFCQERVRFFIDHHFTNCIYKENEPACVKALNAESWIANIDAVLGEQDENRG
jgi:hypothetical protein